MEEVREGAHNGVDIAMPKGTELRSLEDGTVTQIFNGNGNIGEGVRIETDSGQELIYGHMSEVSVKVGDDIDKGEIIGLSGSTGNSTGPHLHFGMKEDGDFIDPTNYVGDLTSNDGSFGFTSPFTMIKGLFDGKSVTERFQDNISDVTQDVLIGICKGIVEFTVDMSGFIALVGGGLLIILKVAGFDKGYKWTGMLFVINVFVKFLSGGE